jgi:EAL domain-containing protein (putative c-di-GMP-specific phosphodiesterase class I)/DNA-binding NarL/FixJ family response regulator
MSSLPYRVLVVEGQPFQREYLLALFRDQGVVHLHAAADGAEAIERLERQTFDLVLSDLLLPGIDGVQLIQHLSALQPPPALALLSAVSPRILGSACQAARDLGLSVIGLLAKPALPDVIAGLLARLAEDLAECRAPGRTAKGFTRTQLIRALARGEIQAWFQPKQSLRSGRIVSAEALARWLHPRQGLLLPGCFIADLGRHGLEEALLWAMLEQSLRAQAAWRESGYRITVSVNLPPRLLDDASLPDRLAEFVLNRGGEPALLCFELTENSIASLPGSYHAGACRLRLKGFGLAQDDFGQGYGTLCNLLSTPFTELKIDRALVHGCIEDETLAAALASSIALGRRLGLEVVAEGVENAEELRLLRTLECDRAQGFLISEAVNAHAFERLLREGHSVESS